MGPPSNGDGEDRSMTETPQQPARFSYHWALIGLSMLVLLCAATWAYEIWGKPGGTAIVIPVGPGRQLHANLWKPGPDYAATDYDRGVLITRRGPLNVMLWYQDHATGTMLRLGSLRLVIWPLVVPTVALALLLGYRYIRRTSRRFRRS
jgi:hypothetical protein